MNKKQKLRKNHKFRLNTPEFELVKEYVRYFVEESNYYNYQLDDGLWVFAEKGHLDEVQFLLCEDHYLGFEGEVFKCKDGLWVSKIIQHADINEVGFKEYRDFRLKESLTKFLDED